MSALKTVLGTLLLALTLSACGSVEQATRSAPFEDVPSVPPPDYLVESFTVTVPRSLTVNEANLYYPRGDIVWRGDPQGDRYMQVKAIFSDSLRAVAPQVTGTRPIRVDVQVTRFHGLSEKARYVVGGVHNIEFKLRLVDTATGLQIGSTKDIVADLEALKGREAMAADGRGETQKARVTAHLIRVLRDELTTSQGYTGKSTGFFAAVNAL